MPTHPLRCRVLAIALGLSALAAPVSGQVQSRAQRLCLNATTKGLLAIVRAQQKDVERCIVAGARGGLPAGQTVAQCVVADDRGRVARTTARVADREAALCAPAPDFGFVAGAVDGAGRTASLDLATALLGADLDAAVATEAAAARCQRRVLHLAGQCAAAFVKEYGRCKRTALAAGAADAAALIPCKGADAAGRLARDCRASLRDAVTTLCAGIDPAAVFAGCAGLPLDACIEGRTLARPSRALDATDGLCAPLGPPAPAPEPVAVSTVPLPSNVTEIQLPWWTHDGSRLVFSARISGYADLQLASVAPDGSDFRCLTCALAMPGDPPLMKPITFPDGQRVLVRLGNQTPVSNSPHGILECSPSVLDCQSAEIVPIELPALGDANLLQPQREFRVAPDGEHVAFTQVRDDSAGHEQFVSIVGTLHRLADRYEILDPRVVSPLGELKQFANDVQSVYVAAFVTNPFDAADSDALQIDLRDGAIARRVTTHPAYDEPVEFSPDDEWFVVGSGRTAGLAETFSQVERPNMISEAIGNVTFFYFLTQRPAMLEPWLLDRHGARDGYIGQPLKPLGIGDGWDGLMIPNWHPDGTRLVWWERILDPSALGPGEIATRIRVAHLTARAPVTTPVLPAPIPALDWAPPLAGYVPPAPAAPASRDGAFSGRAEVVYSDGAVDHIAITYTNYSDDGRRFLDGTEESDYTPGLTGSSTYDADLTQHGCRQGFLRAAGVGLSVAALSGRTTSAVEGNVLTAP